MGHLNVLVRILALTASAPLFPTMVQIRNLALIKTKQITVQCIMVRRCSGVPLCSLGCGVRRCSTGCGVSQLVVRRLAVRQARVRFSSRHPMEASLAERSSDKNTRWRPSANGEV
jgi:hypothetical protein